MFPERRMSQFPRLRTSSTATYKVPVLLRGGTPTLAGSEKHKSRALVAPRFGRAILRRMATFAGEGKANEMLQDSNRGGGGLSVPSRKN
jgi:hypothetical protein